MSGLWCTTAVLRRAKHEFKGSTRNKQFFAGNRHHQLAAGSRKCLENFVFAVQRPQKSSGLWVHTLTNCDFFPTKLQEGDLGARPETTLNPH